MGFKDKYKFIGNVRFKFEKAFMSKREAERKAKRLRSGEDNKGYKLNARIIHKKRFDGDWYYVYKSQKRKR